MKSNFEEDIIKILTERKCSFSYKEIFNLLEIGKGTKKEYLQSNLDSLELKGIIFKNKENSYEIASPNYYVCELFPTQGKSKYVLINDQKYIIDKNDLNGALSFDTVGVKLYNDNTVKVIRTIKRNNGHIVCEMLLTKDGELLPKQVDGDLKVIITSKEKNKLVDGNFVLLKISNEKNKDGYYEATIEQIIGHRNDPNIAITTIAVNKGIPINFNNKYIKALEEIPTEVTPEDLKGRIDLRDKTIFTIDGKNTKDIDDAVGIELLENGNFKLYVSIADVSHYINFDSIFFEEAYKRGTSYYLNNSVFPMFHPIISNGICSLNPKVDRLAKTCIMEIDMNGNVINYEIIKSVINSKMKMNYTDINKIFEENHVNELYKPFLRDLLLMKELSEILEKKKIEKGYLTFKNNDIEIIYDNDGKPIDFIERKQGPAEKLIENFMIWTNQTIAEHVFWQDLPFIYRVHGFPTKYKLDEALELIKSLGYKVNKNATTPKDLQKIIDTLHNEEIFNVLSGILLCAMQRAVYSTLNTGHYALASDCYTHFTSPIRRLSDLTIHILLDKYYFNNEDINNINFKELENKLSDICKQANMTEMLEEEAERAASRLDMGEYMQQLLGQKFIAYITSVNKYAINIITDKNIIGSIDMKELISNNFKISQNGRFVYDRTNKVSYKIGNKILVTASYIDRYNNIIYFSLNNKIDGKKNTIEIENTKKLVRKK